MLERKLIALCLMGLEQSEGFLNHAQVRLAPQRQWQDQEQPLGLADFPARGCHAGFEIKEADLNAVQVSRNGWHSNAEPLERAARSAWRLRNFGRDK